MTRPASLVLRLQRPVASVWAGLALMLGGIGLAQAQEAPSARLTSFASARTGAAPSPWRFTTLPDKNPTRFDVVQLGGKNVLKVEANDSYGNLVHPVRVALADAPTLSWRWRVDEFVAGADLRSRSTDDGAAKVCVFFDFPAERLSFGERTKLALARKATGEDVPAEALCYVWDAREAKGSQLDSAFTRRVRMIVLESGPTTGTWNAERRDLAADYRRVFGDEAGGELPKVIAIAISADADNTHARGVAYFSDLSIDAQAAPRQQASGGGFVPAAGRSGNGE